MGAHEVHAITDGPFGSHLKSSHYTNSGPRVIRLQNIGDGVFIDEKAHISRKHYELLKDHAIYAGDLVIRALGIPAPRACRIPDIGPAIVKADCIRFKVAEKFIDANFVLYALNSPTTQHRTEKKIHGVGRPRLNLGEIKAIALPLPPQMEQKQIAREIEHRLAAANRLSSTLNRQLQQVQVTRQSLLREAFAGNLVPQDAKEKPASDLLERIRAARVADAEEQKQARKGRGKTTPNRTKETADMKKSVPTKDDLQKAWKKIGKEPDAKKLFQAAGFALDQVAGFYGLLRTARDIVEVFKAASKGGKAMSEVSTVQPKQTKQKPGRFRLVSLWLEDFKNLKNYKADFNSAHGLDIILGWNGTGKSNLFESLVIIFRDLHYWWEKNQWPDEPMAGYRLLYEIENHLLEVKWNPKQMKRPEVTRAAITKEGAETPGFARAANKSALDGNVPMQKQQNRNTRAGRPCHYVWPGAPAMLPRFPAACLSQSRSEYGTGWGKWFVSG